MSEAFDEAAEVLGTATFTIAGFVDEDDEPIEFEGVLDRVQRAEGGEEAGGALLDYDATLVAAKAQFATAPPAQRDLAIGADLYRIETVGDDAISYTLALRLRARGGR
ncbi:MAG: hypothetical protein ABMA13_18410 [Chthoniobacteraceae bacterium]